MQSYVSACNHTRLGHAGCRRLRPYALVVRESKVEPAAARNGRGVRRRLKPRLVDLQGPSGPPPRCWGTGEDAEQHEHRKATVISIMPTATFEEALDARIVSMPVVRSQAASCVSGAPYLDRRQGPARFVVRTIANRLGIDSSAHKRRQSRRAGIAPWRSMPPPDRQMARKD